VTDPRRNLPSVASLLESDAMRPLLDRAPRTLVTAAIRATLAAARRAPNSAPRDEEGWAAAIDTALMARERPSLRALFNATGVILHTNLGRAPLTPAAIDAITATAGGYTNLEYDLERGERGSRYVHCTALLRELTGAEDAMVVNNCAAALVLALNEFAGGRDAIISRGELIEIGGNFRVPEIMGKSGARLVEVGTTNRTTFDDYRRALGAGAGAIVKVHRSNFTVQGFVAEATLAELAPLAAEFDVPLIHDFGSGLLLRLDEWGLTGEPTTGDAVRAGATLVMMSGDKLLGGPQAGIIVGKAEAMSQLRKNPLARAMRVDKLTLAALEATLALYRAPERAVREIPTLAMLTAPADDVRQRADRVREALEQRGLRARLVQTEASVGGGAFPTARIPSTAVALGGDAMELDAKLRGMELPIVGRIEDQRLLLDLRSVPEEHDEAFLRALLAALA
jgi:L-seryl-tRNA(Ser) seleniumtransferase